LSNVDPVPAVAADTLKQRLSQQMTGSVRWREISFQLAENGVEKVVEIGPGNVLTGLIKRTSPSLTLEMWGIFRGYGDGWGIGGIAKINP
jgi:[acyl-carrier-protein] S-malonyltransferase